MIFSIFICTILGALFVRADSFRREQRGSFSTRVWGSGRKVEKVVNDDDVEISYFSEQLIDHFDPLNKERWSQRFFVNDKYYKEGGPVFLMIGGEAPADTGDVTNYNYVNFAKKLGGYCVSLEHRYYGESNPVEYHEPKDLKYLSSRQGLADLVQFRHWFGNERGLSDNPWILVGGSYSGAMAAWAQTRYPHLWVGSLASSAPIEVLEDFSEYLKIIENGLGTDTCKQAVSNAVQAVEEALKTDDGKKKLEENFHMSHSIGTTDKDISYFMMAITDPIAGIIQYAQGDDIANMCNTFEREGDIIQNYADVINAEYSDAGFDPLYEDYVAELREPEHTSAASSRSWMYQCCTEFAWWQTGSDSIFSDLISLDWYSGMCADIFDLSPHVPVDITNMLYGNRKCAGEHIYLANGNIDPWNVLALQNGEGSEEHDRIVHKMDTTSHCADMYMYEPSELTDELRDVQADQMKVICGWLGISDTDCPSLD